MKNSTRRAILIAVVALLSVFIIVGVWLNLRKAPPQTPGSGLSTPTTTAFGRKTAEAATTASVSVSKSSAAADLAGCAKVGTEIVATRFDVPARKLSEPVITVGTEADGAVGAPPLDQKFSVGVWDKGPKVGSAQGNVIATVHTWTGDVALGNILNEGGEQALAPGDIIRLSDGTTTVCYRYREKLHFTVASYDPNSTVWINPNGKPQLTIMICDDYNANSKEWDSRILFYADAVSA